MVFTTLIDPATLAEHLTDPDFAIVDCRFKVDDVAWGRAEYERAHIPGAAFADVEHDLSAPVKGKDGRHPLPSPDAFVQTVSRLGIDRRTQVVTYDQGAGMYAGRFWWMLRWMGHDGVALLDGGFAAWQAEGRPTVGGTDTRRPRPFTGRARQEMVATATEVQSRVAQPDWRVVDARAPERFRGEIEPIDRIAGHIAGAVNHPYARNVTAESRFHTPEQLRAQFATSLGGVAADHVICYCGSGVTACQNILALEHAGLTGAKLYPGSWSEWIELGMNLAVSDRGTEDGDGRNSATTGSSQTSGQ
jgi:thiosulfate/3-mercaptopyruvate sulfurtransferase